MVKEQVVVIPKSKEGMPDLQRYSLIFNIYSDLKNVYFFLKKSAGHFIEKPKLKIINDENKYLIQS